MTRAIFIVGLPGAGKSYYARQLAREIDATLFDDFKANAIGDCSHFPFAKSYVELINVLRSGKDSIISDIDFCKTESRNEARQCIEQLVQGVEVEWIFFENDPEECRENIIRRAKMEGRKQSGPIDALERYSKVYVISDDSHVIPVWDSATSLIQRSRRAR